MKKYLVNGREIILSQQNYVTRGGEGLIFNIGSVGYKIYEDLKKMIPEAKIKELNQLQLKNIIRPIDIVYDAKKQLVGFTMDWLGDKMTALCKLFTNGFRNTNNITNDQTIELIENMKDIIKYVHEHDCLIVDNNELNSLVADDWVTPYFIDVNSWQTKSFPATAIMPSVQDYRSNGFSELTDWFSFAVISFQLFVGIHPFKGRHPNYGMNDFKKRIIDCVSVLNPKVTIPPVTRDFKNIPGPYMDWYLKLFEKGERLPPPLKAGQAAVVQPKLIIIQSTNKFDITEIASFDSTILFNNVINNLDITKTQSQLFLGKFPYVVSPGVEVVYVPFENIPVFIKIENNRSVFYSPNPNYKIKNLLSIQCTDKMIVNNVLYLKDKEKLIEMNIKRMNENIIISPKMTWKVEPNSSQLLSNIVFQSILGKAYVAIPIAKYSGSKMIIKPVPELDEYKIIDGKYENRVCMFNIFKNNIYSKATLIFDETYTNYKFILVDDVDYIPINFVTLENGICVCITHDDAVEIFSNNIKHYSLTRVEDPIINSNMRLCHDATQVRFFQDNKLYTIKMRK